MLGNTRQSVKVASHNATAIDFEFLPIYTLLKSFQELILVEKKSIHSKMSWNIQLAWVRYLSLGFSLECFSMLCSATSGFEGIQLTAGVFKSSFTSLRARCFRWCLNGGSVLEKSPKFV